MWFSFRRNKSRQPNLRPWLQLNPRSPSWNPPSGNRRQKKDICSLAFSMSRDKKEIKSNQICKRFCSKTPLASKCILSQQNFKNNSNYPLLSKKYKKNKNCSKGTITEWISCTKKLKYKRLSLSLKKHKYTRLSL